MLGKQDLAVILKMKVKQEEPKPVQDTIRHVATAFAAKVAAALAVAGLANDGNGGCRGAMGKRGSRWSVCKESQAVSFCGITHLVRDTFILDTVLPRGCKMGSDRLERSQRLPALGTRLSEAWGEQLGSARLIATGGMAHCHKIWTTKWNVFLEISDFALVCFVQMWVSLLILALINISCDTGSVSGARSSDGVFASTFRRTRAAKNL